MNYFIRLIYYIFNKPQTINKIGIFINEQYTLQFYENILNKLEIDNFTIILADKFKHKKHEKFLNKLKSCNYNLVFLKNILYVKKYKILLSHVYFGGDTVKAETLITRLKISLTHLFKKVGLKFFRISNQQFFQKKIGFYNIKFMYGLDNNFKKKTYDNLFDEFFCHSHKDAEYHKKNFNSKIFIMGYPRYDNYLQNKDNKEIKEKLKKKYLCSFEKPTILWICTISESFSTIVTYSKYIEMLKDKYNIILRPHPIEIDPKQRRFNKKVFDIVNSKKFILSLNSSQNMEELYLISDFVFCDYGGSVFSALYCCKNILLLNNKNHIYDENINESTSLEIRNYLPSINESNCNKNFVSIIENKLLLSKKMNKINNARKIYFGNVINQSCSESTSNRLKKILSSKIF